MNALRRRIRPHGIFLATLCLLGPPAALLACASSDKEGELPEERHEAAELLEEEAKTAVEVASYDPQRSLAPLIKAVSPAVVSVRVRGAQEGFRSFSLPPGALGKQGSPDLRALPLQGMGSGFLISGDGLILTNHHVVSQARNLEVELKDGRVFAAERVGSDPATDTALLRLLDVDAAGEFPHVSLAEPDSLEVGDWVIALGSPMGLEQSVTRGIVSAKGRGSLGMYQDGYVDFLQTDAAINPGNSGGPLFNLEGQVVGMNTAIAGIGRGIGFAVPARQLERVLPDLKAHGKVERGWLGIGGRELVPALGTAPESGAVVGVVHSGTPAAAAGLSVGDRIVKIDGVSVENFDDLRGRVGEHGPGETLELEIERDGEEQSLKAVLGKRPSPEELAAIARGQRRGPADGNAEGLWGGGEPRLGIEVRNDDEGIEIVNVLPGSVADRLGLRAGDRIETINGKKVRRAEAIAGLLGKSNERVKVRVRRGRSQLDLALQSG